jgi:hypothetical protein
VDILSFFLAYAKNPLIPFHTWQANVPKAPAVVQCCFQDYAKMDCIVLFAGNCLSSNLQQKRVHASSSD